MSGPTPEGYVRPATIAQMARAARRLLPRPVWDFIAGGAGDERTLRANTAAFDQVLLRPRALAGVDKVDLSVQILGVRWPAPVGVAPMAYHTLVHPEGEVATVRGAGAAGAPMIVSTFAGRRLEEIAAEATVPLWLQLYGFRDRDQVLHLMERAASAGFGALVLTADTPLMGRRPRDIRNGFRLPPGIEAPNLDRSVSHPTRGGDITAPADHARAVLDASLTWANLTALRAMSPLPLVVKGVLTASDARRAVDAGAAGIIVSNHGGRQLDGAPASLEALPEVVAAVAGYCPIFLDGGVRRGVDVLAALAFGADAVFVGRPILYGLAVGGPTGVRDVLSLLTEEITDAMMLTGRAGAAECDLSLIWCPELIG